MHAEELNGLIHASPSFFMSTPAGRIINRFSQVDLEHMFLVYVKKIDL